MAAERVGRAGVCEEGEVVREGEGDCGLVPSKRALISALGINNKFISVSKVELVQSNVLNTLLQSPRPHSLTAETFLE